MTLVKKPFKIRLNKGDTVVVRAGKYKGKTGKISAVHPTSNKVTVDGINIVKKHVKPNSKYPQGGIIERTIPIDVSKVGIASQLSTKDTPKASRIGFSVKADGTKVRIMKRTGKEIK